MWQVESDKGQGAKGMCNIRLLVAGIKICPPFAPGLPFLACLEGCQQQLPAFI